MSSIGCLEAAMLQRRGRWLEAGLQELPLDGPIALAAAERPDDHAVTSPVTSWSQPLPRLKARH